MPSLSLIIIYGGSYRITDNTALIAVITYCSDHVAAPCAMWLTHVPNTKRQSEIITYLSVSVRRSKTNVETSANQQFIMHKLCAIYSIILFIWDHCLTSKLMLKYLSSTIIALYLHFSKFNIRLVSFGAQLNSVCGHHDTACVQF